MTISVHIAGVDGSSHSISVATASEALKFLEAYDHEGSSVGVVVDADNEEMYAVLRLLNAVEGA